MSNTITVSRSETIGRATINPGHLTGPDTITISRAELAALLREAGHVSRVLNRVENLHDLDWEALDDLCRAAFRTTRALSAMLDTKEVNA